MSHESGKATDDNFRPLASVRQNIVTGNLWLGFSFGKGIELEKGSDDWLDMMEILEDLCPGKLEPNRNDKGRYHRNGQGKTAAKGRAAR